MKTIFRIAWLAPVLALAIAARAAAQDAPALNGKVLILANDRVLEGEIGKLGNQYQIRRGAGETLIDADRAKRLCRDWDDALAYMRSQANLADPDERLRLARWCRQYELREQALVEVRVALEMRPTHAETKHLAHILERACKPAPAPAPRAVQAAPAPMPERQPERQPALDVSADTLAGFATKVQPILMNACAACHTRGRGGSFQLDVVTETGARAITQRNLAATMPYLKLDQPNASPLLAKSVSAHGEAALAPIRDRRAVPFQVLHAWIEQVAINNPHLVGQVVAVAPRVFNAELPAAPAAPMMKSGPITSPNPPVISRPVTRVEVGAAVAPNGPRPVQTEPVAATSATPSQPAAAARNPGDTYDPAEFNNKNVAAK